MRCYCGRNLVHDREGVLVCRQCRLQPSMCDCFAVEYKKRIVEAAETDTEYTTLLAGRMPPIGR
jgi:hypothetical protein